MFLLLFGVAGVMLFGLLLLLDRFMREQERQWMTQVSGFDPITGEGIASLLSPGADTSIVPRWQAGELILKYTFQALDENGIQNLTIKELTVDGHAADLPRNKIVGDIARGKSRSIDVHVSSYSGKGGISLKATALLVWNDRFESTDNRDVWVPRRPAKGKL